MFEFATATRILFGKGSLQQVPAAAAGWGNRVFVVTGRSAERAAPLLDALHSQDLKTSLYHVLGEPTVAMVIEAVNQARHTESDVVIGLGGGSAIDAGKVVAALLTNNGDMMEYLEVVGEGRSIQIEPAPYIAIPTTAGTGAEVTRNAVLGVPSHRRKVSMRSPMMLPRLAVVDPELTYSLPPDVTAYTGLDALTQVIEPFISHMANPLTDTICREGIRRAARSLNQAYDNGCDSGARVDMAFASLCGGLALANAKLGAVHGLAGPLGGEIVAPHGAVCGCLLPYVMEVNLKALEQRSRDANLQARFDELGPLLTGRSEASASEAISWIFALCERLRTKPLATWGLVADEIPRIAEVARTSSSMKGNPIELTHDEIVSILQKAYS
ncbi:iron-containing alcohol dehydrogenase [Planctomycetota bacterium]